MNFKKSDLKTRGFRVYEENRYDYESKKEIKLGMAYAQSATLKFDYDMNIISQFMTKISALKNPPKYHLTFNLKNITECKNEVLAEAYNMAKEKAQAIAYASNKDLKDCVKIDFRPFDEKVISNTRLGRNMYNDVQNFDFQSEKGMATSKSIMNIFTPEDIEITETLYCLWIAE